MSSSESDKEPFSASESEYNPDETEDSQSSSSEESQSETAGQELENQGHKPKRLGKKRFREPDKHVKAIRKRKRNTGEEYVSTSNKVVAAKSFNNINCNCRKKCFDKLTELERKRAFENFWKMGNFSSQNAFICGLVKQLQVKAHRPRDKSRAEKLTTNSYFVNTPTNTHNVCKQYFLQTFQISNGRLARALQRGRVSSPGEDLRGKHVPANKTPEEKLEHVREHIASFPAYQSHYTRSHNPNRKYLDSNLNLRIMYNLYKEKCIADNIIAVSEAMYRNIFHRDFNLHFHVPSKDTCVRCDLFKSKMDCEGNEQERKKYEIQHTMHLRKAENARKNLALDKSSCILEKDKIYGFTFDLEKALPYPTLTCSIAYYKRNMYVYNLGIHELSEEENGFMYVWDETTASRGSQEIGSCIRKHIQQYAGRASHIIAYSDACGGQNRNFKQCLLWLKLLADTDIQIIDHKFMVSGHSFLPNDRDFGQIEQYAKNRIKYVPGDWYTIIRRCRSKNPFKVHEMKQNEFYSCIKLEQAVTRRNTNEEKLPVSWLNIQWIQVRKDEPYKIFYKETLNRDYPFECINLLPGRKGKPQNFQNIILPPLYQSQLPVNDKKKKDMEELFQFIPPINQQYFRNLIGVEHAEDIGPLEESGEPQDT